MNLLNSFCCRWLVGLTETSSASSNTSKRNLQEEVVVLKEQLGKKPRLRDDQRRRLAANAKRLGLESLQRVTTIVTPRTLLSWHQRLIVRKYDGRAKRSPGRPPTPAEGRDLILSMAAQNRS